MILSTFTPPPGAQPNLIGHCLSWRAYPLDCRTPEPLAKLLKRLERR